MLDWLGNRIHTKSLVFDLVRLPNLIELSPRIEFDLVGLNVLGVNSVTVLACTCTKRISRRIIGGFLLFKQSNFLTFYNGFTRYQGVHETRTDTFLPKFST